MSGVAKVGPTKVYAEADLALFAAYRDARRQVQPAACTGGPQCWVSVGPPGFSGRDGYFRCVECAGSIRSRGVQK